MSIFEIGMLVCFGCSWPVNIYKSYTSKSTGCKTPVFSYLIILGYVCGVINKILYNPDFVIALYVLNILMVFIDLLLYYRNKKYEQTNA